MLPTLGVDDERGSQFGSSRGLSHSPFGRKGGDEKNHEEEKREENTDEEEEEEESGGDGTKGSSWRMYFGIVL